MSIGEKIKNYCARCDFITNHSILYEKNIPDDEDEPSYSYNYYVVQCMGCERISYRTDFEDYLSGYPDENDEWDYEIITHLYPNILKNHKHFSKSHLLPNNIAVVYKEAIKAFTEKCYLLTGVAFRALIEAICIDKEIPGRNLEFKINNLFKSKLITENEAKRLHSIRFLGNDSVHEMAVPDEKALYFVLKIVEHLLENLYIIDLEAKNKLETVISNFEEFSKLLEKVLKNFKSGDEFPLAKYLGKNIRRLNGKLQQFEGELITHINNGDYNKLSIGKIDKFGNSQETLQHFQLR